MCGNCKTGAVSVYITSVARWQVPGSWGGGVVPLCMFFIMFPPRCGAYEIIQCTQMSSRVEHVQILQNCGNRSWNIWLICFNNLRWVKGCEFINVSEIYMEGYRNVPGTNPITILLWRSGRLRYNPIAFSAKTPIILSSRGRALVFSMGCGAFIVVRCVV